jgi:hypothetical protein
MVLLAYSVNQKGCGKMTRHQYPKFKQNDLTSTRKNIDLSDSESSLLTLANHKFTVESVPALYKRFNVISTQ